ncbi:chlorophyll A/B binding protein of LHCII type 1-like protein [Tanacetum coccineum]
MDTLSLVLKYLNGMEDILDDGDSMEARKLTVEKRLLCLRRHLLVPTAGLSRVFPCLVMWAAKTMEMIGYANEGEPSVLFGRDFLVTSKSRVDFRIGEMRIDLTMLEEMKEIDAKLDLLVKNLEEVGSSNGDLVKMGKASRNKNHKVNKLTHPPQIKIKEIPTTSTIAPQSPIYHPLTQKKEKVKEVLDRKYKELEEPKPILEMLENYMTYRKKLDEVLMGRARLNSDDYGEEIKMRIVEHGTCGVVIDMGYGTLCIDDGVIYHTYLPNKMCDPSNFVLPVKVNRTIKMNALADTGASVSVLPYCLFMNLGLGDPKPYNSNLTMADNKQAKAMGEVKNVRIQIRYQAYLVDFLILDIPMDKELPLLLGSPFLRTCGAVIDMGRDTLCIDNGVIRHTDFPKPRAKAYLDNFA